MVYHYLPGKKLRQGYPQNVFFILSSIIIKLHQFKHIHHGIYAENCSVYYKTQCIFTQKVYMCFKSKLVSVHEVWACEAQITSLNRHTAYFIELLKLKVLDTKLYIFSPNVYYLHVCTSNALC